MKCAARLRILFCGRIDKPRGPEIRCADIEYHYLRLESEASRPYHIRNEFSISNQELFMTTASAAVAAVATTAAYASISSVAHKAIPFLAAVASKLFMVELREAVQTDNAAARYTYGL
jgi:hypothetical protein